MKTILTRILFATLLAFTSLQLWSGCTQAGTTTTTPADPAAIRATEYKQLMTLKVIGEAGAAAMTTVSRLEKEGKITHEQRLKVNDYYDNIFQPAYRLATQYITSPQQRANTLASPDLLLLLGQLTALIASLTSTP